MNFLQDLGNETMDRLHPITLKQEVTVDVKVAAVVSLNLNTKGILGGLQVKEVGDVVN